MKNKGVSLDRLQNINAVVATAIEEKVQFPNWKAHPVRVNDDFLGANDDLPVQGAIKQQGQGV
jgi:hypothetical protein